MHVLHIKQRKLLHYILLGYTLFYQIGMTVETNAIFLFEICSEIMKCCSLLDTSKSAYTNRQTHFFKQSACLLINIYSPLYVFRTHKNEVSLRHKTKLNLKNLLRTGLFHVSDGKEHR